MGSLAISTLSAGWQTFIYALAVGMLVLDGIGFTAPKERMRLGSIGLALFVFVFFWNALAAT